MESPPAAPTDDVEALVSGLSVSVATITAPNGSGQRDVTFDYHCEDCGGCVITLPDGQGPEDPALCKACGRVFGKYKAVLALCRDEYRRFIGA